MLVIPAIPMMWIQTADPLHVALTSGSAWLSAFARDAVPGAIAALWQGVVIALALAVCLRFAPRIRVRLGAAQRFAVWAAAFVIIAIFPFLPSFPFRASFGNAVIVSSGSASPAQSFHFPFVQIGEGWALGVAALWLVASLVRAAGLMRHSIYLHRLWSSATPVAADENLRVLLAAASPVRRPIELCTTREFDRPSVIGFFAPRILIPEWLFLRLTPSELEHVVLHEAEHLRRRDDWINLLQKFVLVLFPLNPALVWIERRLCREREMACDEGVVRHTQAPRAYAASLANLASHALDRRHVRALSAEVLSLGAFEHRSELSCRISSLLARKPTLHPIAARALVAIAACGLLAASLELARCPQMVAFVPAAPTENSQSELAQTDLPATQGDRVFDQRIGASNLSSFRALRAKAAVPTEQISLRHPYGAASSGAKAQYSMSDAGGPTKAVQLLENMPPAGRSSQRESSFRQGTNERAASTSWSGVQAGPAANQPQVIVFTTWQEIETRHGTAVADYDTNASAQINSTDSETATRTRQTERAPIEITVTRLIFWIAPRPASSNTAVPDSKSQRSTTSDSLQLPAPAPVSGWLIFQL